MAELSLEDIEFIKILSNSDSTILQQGMNEATRYRLDSQIGIILREYYKENTMNTKTGWIEKFEKAGITEDDGKSAIACARRLGIDIS
ncbi:hypothetical protein [Nitrosarchaeum sp. AC2]|uniref:hypothetical protein n=1 Tax=Nitrosarchaeum sp. AC2 TaxID=2259673 RepID=UPI0015CDF8EB|nr:hypothetical protein [Nitrosarchaeum sp. AC2]QLH10792.1 hypothetical protein DSQ20_04390 [Nitrosarchaeum sp. AC2]